MSIPTIDTFEHDISEELKSKEASIRDIASASGTVSNTTEETPTSTSSYKKIVLLVGICGIVIGGSVYGYYILHHKEVAPVIAPVATTTPILTTTPESQNIVDLINSVSPYLSSTLANHITHVDKNPFGTILTIDDYRLVFAYMIEHEKDVAMDVLAGTYDTSSSTPTFAFTDVTESNQNMRMTQTDTSAFYYAFIDEQHLVFATTSLGIIAARTAITQ